ncbi:centromere protein K [Brachionichthys hirsutus]|uniref:centromere protein K n=1 Tax=Brachionichthys hirsutus TaxID=412623 RepID=UPI003604B094
MFTKSGCVDENKEKPGGQLSEAAQSDLMQMCENQFAELDKLQTEIFLCEPDFCQNLQKQCVNRLRATEAELKHLLTVEPELLASNSEILLQTGKDEMLKLCSELEVVASCCEAKRDKLRETKELEQKWLEEKKRALVAAHEHVEQLKSENINPTMLRALQDTKVEIHTIKQYAERLMECLGDILERHMPHPHSASSVSKKTKSIRLASDEDLISVGEILELLMNKMLSTPHDPYVTIDNTFWPPYIEMLLRYGIAVRHQENNFKIRLETFY